MMNTTPNSSAAQSPPRPQQAQGARPDGSDRPQSLAERQQGERFARLLREKSARPGAENESGPQAPMAEPAPQPGCIAPSARRFEGLLSDERQDDLPTHGVGAAPVHAGGPQGEPNVAHEAPRAPDAPVSASRAALDAALNAEPAQLVTGRGAEASWTATVREPLGMAVEVRATRITPDTAQAGRSGWSLTIAAPAVDTGMLARHAPRLSERLKTRAIEHTHVRIQRDDEEPA